MKRERKTKSVIKSIDKTVKKKEEEQENFINKQLENLPENLAAQLKAIGYALRKEREGMSVNCQEVHHAFRKIGMCALLKLPIRYDYSVLTKSGNPLIIPEEAKDWFFRLHDFMNGNLGDKFCSPNKISERLN